MVEVLLPMEWKRRQEKGYQNCNAAIHPLSQEHEARRKFCPSLKSEGIAHSAATGLELIVSTRTANPKCDSGTLLKSQLQIISKGSTCSVSGTLFA
ncbi:hypothetical protein BDL97_02G199200 [Sphagnum fallax]|nr:hypothetical protein BDL97_02G199200 [Sphagnum fallax]